MSEDRRITDPFKDDLHELVKKVSEMSGTLVRIEEKLKTVDEHHRTLYGAYGQPGLTTIVDRQDQREKARQKHLAAIYTTLICLVINAFWRVLTGTKAP